MSGAEWQIVGFTVRVATLATLAILPPGLAVAWLLARRPWPGKSLVETLVALPLVMPAPGPGRRPDPAGPAQPVRSPLHLDQDVFVTVTKRLAKSAPGTSRGPVRSPPRRAASCVRT